MIAALVAVLAVVAVAFLLALAAIRVVREYERVVVFRLGRLRAARGPGLRQWLRNLPRVEGGRAATFDTRIGRSAALTGSAARGIARRLRRRGYPRRRLRERPRAGCRGAVRGRRIRLGASLGAELATSSGESTADI